MSANEQQQSLTGQVVGSSIQGRHWALCSFFHVGFEIGFLYVAYTGLELTEIHGLFVLKTLLSSLCSGGSRDIGKPGSLNGACITCPVGVVKYPAESSLRESCGLTVQGHGIWSSRQLAPQRPRLK